VPWLTELPRGVAGRAVERRSERDRGGVDEVVVGRRIDPLYLQAKAPAIAEPGYWKFTVQQKLEIVLPGCAANLPSGMSAASTRTWNEDAASTLRRERQMVARRRPVRAHVAGQQARQPNVTLPVPPWSQSPEGDTARRIMKHPAWRLREDRVRPLVLLGRRPAPHERRGQRGPQGRDGVARVSRRTLFEIFGVVPSPFARPFGLFRNISE
jgi:hypothetical protein